MPALRAGIKFEKAAKPHKYVAIFPDGKKVRFGHQDYEHYRDSVPPSRGGGVWKHKDHGDKQRRNNYRNRAKGVILKSGTRAIDHKYSPAWFSYHFLW